MSPEKFHPSEEGQSEKNPDDSDGVRQMRRRIFLLACASMAIPGGCQKPHSSAKEPEPTAEPKEVDADEAKEAEPGTRKIIVEDLWPGFLIYPEGYKHGNIITPAVEKAWQERATQFKRELRQDPRFLELESAGLEPEIVFEKLKRGRDAGKIVISVFHIIIE